MSATGSRVAPGFSDHTARVSSVPIVTVAILNYQGMDILRATLRYVLAQQYDALEVVVVDNGSTDGSVRMVSEEFPAVRVVSLPGNVGCGARNAGLAEAKGTFVVTLDNDVLLISPDAISTIVDTFNSRPSVACINFKIVNARSQVSRRDWCHPRDLARYADEEFLTDAILEGACAFRREVFQRVGGYWEPLFLGLEGPDLVLRLVDGGHDVLYSPAVIVRHLGAEALPSSRIYYLWPRNSIWIALRHHRPREALGSIAKELALMGFAAARARCCRAYLLGALDGLLGAPCALHTRRTLAPSTYERLREIRALSPSLLAKAKRHWRERLL
jgi:hypothetical protein